LVLGHCVGLGGGAAACSLEPLVVALDAVGGLGAVGEGVEQHGIQLGVGGV
jgi:hypothetical protein